MTYRFLTFKVLLVACAGLANLSGNSPAQDPEKKLTVRWFGQSMFQVETSLGKKVVFDPHAIPEFGRAVVQADVITSSHFHSDHTQVAAIENFKAARYFPGLEEGKKGKAGDWKKYDEKVGMIRLRSVGLYHDAEEGLARGKNTAFVIEADGFTVCHLGDIGHELTPAQLKAIGPVDILMVPVGGVYTVNGEKARGVVKQINPRLYVFPMHYGVPGYEDLLPVDEFLEGMANVKKLPATNEFAIPLDAKSDSYTTIILGWKKEEVKKP